MNHYDINFALVQSSLHKMTVLKYVFPCFLYNFALNFDWFTGLSVSRKLVIMAKAIVSFGPDNHLRTTP